MSEPTMTGVYVDMESPLGTLWLGETARGVAHLRLGARPAFFEHWQYRADHQSPATEALDAYFRGERREVELDLALESGTDFQRQVWREVQRIPYGERRSYQQIAEALGRPTATRAVGAANGQNPIAILIPCHRVVAASGSLRGYAWGLEAKRWLLEHEARHAAATAARGRTS